MPYSEKLEIEEMDWITRCRSGQNYSPCSQNGLFCVFLIKNKQTKTFYSYQQSTYKLVIFPKSVHLHDIVVSLTYTYRMIS